MTLRRMCYGLLFVLVMTATADAQRWQRVNDKAEVVPMADLITIWTNGDADGDWSAAGNWTAGVPDNSRDAGANEYFAVFDGNVNNDPVTTGLDNNAVTISGLLTRANYGTDATDMLGSPSNPLIINIASAGPSADNWTDNAVFRGRGNYFFESGQLGEYMPIVVDTPLGPDTVTLSGTIRDVLGKSGRVNIIIAPTGTGVLTSIRCLGPQSHITVTAAVVGSGGPIQIDSGRLILNFAQAGPIEIHANGGLLEINKVLNDATGVPKINIDGGTVIYRPDTAPAQTVALYAIAGILDLRELRFDQTWGPVVVGPDMIIEGTQILNENLGLTSLAIDLRKDEP